TFRVSAVNRNNIPSLTPLASTSTLAGAVTNLPDPFFAVFETSAAVAWGSLPESPPALSSHSAEGYALYASSTNFGAAAGGGVISSSLTAGVTQSTLTVTGLERNTTYYFRVGALNWNGAANFTITGATSTRAQPPAGMQAFSMFETSAAVNWIALAASPQAVSAEGYVLEASSTAFGALAPDGVTYSSRTTNITLSTLTVSGLETNTTYYFRAGTLDWSGRATYGVGAASATLAAPPDAPAYALIHVTSVTVSWTAVASSGYELQASVNPTFTPVFFTSTTAAGATSLRVAGLTADTTYHFRVGSINRHSIRNYAGVGSTSTLTVPPTTPSLTAGGVFFTSATVQWAAVTSQGYLLEASTASNFSGDVW
ncbi:MAG: hypothetical protein FD126_3484, partial [Elusimicrobia bacterium]